MRTPFILVLFSIFILGATVSAESLDAATFIHAAFTPQGELAPQLYPQIQKANADFQQLPGPVLTLFGNQRIRLDLTLDDGTIETIGIVTVNNSIQTLTRYAPSNASLGVQTDEETVNTIAMADNKASAFVDAVNTGKLKYQGLSSEASFTTFAADIAVFVTNLITVLAQLLGF
ncbi:MAG: hypothetical protein AABX02_03165 [archaeon]